jgi:hypothetical protein
MPHLGESIPNGFVVNLDDWGGKVSFETCTGSEIGSSARGDLAGDCAMAFYDFAFDLALDLSSPGQFQVAGSPQAPMNSPGDYSFANNGDLPFEETILGYEGGGFDGLGVRSHGVSPSSIWPSRSRSSRLKKFISILPPPVAFLWR